MALCAARLCLTKVKAEQFDCAEFQYKALGCSGRCQKRCGCIVMKVRGQEEYKPMEDCFLFFCFFHLCMCHLSSHMLTRTPLTVACFSLLVLMTFFIFLSWQSCWGVKKKKKRKKIHFIQRNNRKHRNITFPYLIHDLSHLDSSCVSWLHTNPLLFSSSNLTPTSGFVKPSFTTTLLGQCFKSSEPLWTWTKTSHMNRISSPTPESPISTFPPRPSSPPLSSCGSLLCSIALHDL